MHGCWGVCGCQGVCVAKGVVRGCLEACIVARGACVFGGGVCMVAGGVCGCWGASVPFFITFYSVKVVRGMVTFGKSKATKFFTIL